MEPYLVSAGEPTGSSILPTSRFTPGLQKKTFGGERPYGEQFEATIIMLVSAYLLNY